MSSAADRLGTDPVVVLREVTLDRDRPGVLRDVSLDLERGAMVAVSGPSASGKTSLLRVVAGELSVQGGTVAASVDVAMVREDLRTLAPSLTALENVLLPLVAGGLGVTEARSRADHALDLVGLVESGGHLIDQLSGGQQQRVAIAQALASEAAVLLADEPTSALDPENRDRVLALLRTCAREGAAVLVATNDSEVAVAADGEIRLDEGRAAWMRRPAI